MIWLRGWLLRSGLRAGRQDVSITVAQVKGKACFHRFNIFVGKLKFFDEKFWRAIGGGLRQRVINPLALRLQTSRSTLFSAMTRLSDAV